MTTHAGTKLTEQHRRSQLALRAKLLREIVVVWQVFDVEAIDESWVTLEPILMTFIEVYRMRSSRIAYDYYQSFRRAEGVKAPFPTLTPEIDWRPAALVSLRVTGPVATKAAVLHNAPDLKATSLVRIAGAVSRIMLNGGRETLIRCGNGE